MTKLHFFSAAMALLLLFGCKKEEDKTQPYDDYRGTWSGTYSGEDSGTWEAMVNENGEVVGSFTSDNADTTFSGTGSLSADGKIHTTVPVDTGAVIFEGVLNSSVGSGNWENTLQQITGSWEGEKN